jgi:putative transposase
MNRAYRFRLYPKEKQAEQLEQTLTLCRWLYNAALEHRIIAYRNGQSVSYLQQANELPVIKREFPEYASVHSQALQETLKRLDKAYKAFFRRVAERRRGSKIKAGFPRFKGERRFDSVTYPQKGFRLLPNGHLQLSKIGEVRMFMHRVPTGKVKTLNLKRDRCGCWYAVLTVEKPVAKRKGRPAVGVDLGLRSLVTLSTGEALPVPRFLRRSEAKLKRLQRRVSRKEKGSGKRRKAVLRLATGHRKVERQRTDFLHNLSHRLARCDVVFEKLNVSGMLKNHCLAKSIADASWGRLVGMTIYKAEDAGGRVVLVDPRYSSQECSNCHEHVNVLLKDRVFVCPSCGLILCRDVNAARVVLQRGVGRGTAEFTPAENAPLLQEQARSRKREAPPFREERMSRGNSQY